VEKIEVNEADIDAEVERMVQGANNDARVRELFSSPSGRESLRRNIYMRKTIDRLFEIATNVEESIPSVE